MKVTIKEIEVLDDRLAWTGYNFTMSDPSKNIICKISNSQKCCEHFGIHTKNNLKDFIGSEYYSVTIEKEEQPNAECFTIVKVSINTSRGVILIILYNNHNGYYRHDFYIETQHGLKIESL